MFVGARSVLVVLGLVGCAPPVHVPEEGRVWKDLVASPCAIDAEGLVTCWTSDLWEEQASLDGDHVARPGTRLYHEPDSDLLQGWDVDGWVAPIACDAGPNPCPAPFGPVVQPSMGFGLTAGGTLNMGASQWAFDGDAPWLVVANNAHVALNTRHELHIWQAPPDRVPTLALNYEPTDIVGIGNAFPGGCVLDDGGEITCAGVDEWSMVRFDEGPYRHISGSLGTICAMREIDDVIECGDGSVYDWGPLLTMAVRGDWQSYPYVPSAPASVCAITVANEIRCEGERYTASVRFRLDELNRLNRRPIFDLP